VSGTEEAVATTTAETQERDEDAVLAADEGDASPDDDELEEAVDDADEVDDDDRDDDSDDDRDEDDADEDDADEDDSDDDDADDDFEDPAPEHLRSKPHDDAEAAA
jgi:hypothetical protein